MPNNVVKSIAARAGKSPEAVEGKWKQAESLVSKQYPHLKKGDEDYYRLVNSLTHKLSGVKESMNDKLFSNAFSVSADNGKAYYDSADKFKADAAALGAVVEATGNILVAMLESKEIGRYNSAKTGTLTEGYGTIATGAAPSTSGDITTSADGDDINTTIQAGVVFDQPAAELPPVDDDLDDGPVTTPISFDNMVDNELEDIADVQESHKPMSKAKYLELVETATGGSKEKVLETWNKVHGKLLAEGVTESADELNALVSEAVLVEMSDEAKKYKVVFKDKKGTVVHVVGGEPMLARQAERVHRGALMRIRSDWSAHIVPHDSAEAKTVVKESEGQMFDDHKKVIATYNSAKTPAHFEAAYNMHENFVNRYRDRVPQEVGFALSAAKNRASTNTGYAEADASDHYKMRSDFPYPRKLKETFSPGLDTSTVMGPVNNGPSKSSPGVSTSTPTGNLTNDAKTAPNHGESPAVDDKAVSATESPGVFGPKMVDGMMSIPGSNAFSSGNIFHEGENGGGELAADEDEDDDNKELESEEKELKESVVHDAADTAATGYAGYTVGRTLDAHGIPAKASAEAHQAVAASATAAHKAVAAGGAGLHRAVVKASTAAHEGGAAIASGAHQAVAASAQFAHHAGSVAAKTGSDIAQHAVHAGNAMASAARSAGHEGMAVAHEAIAKGAAVSHEAIGKGGEIAHNAISAAKPVAGRIAKVAVSHPVAAAAIATGAAALGAYEMYKHHKANDAKPATA